MTTRTTPGQLTLAGHHTIEDTTIWPPLLARCDAAGDLSGRATLEAMQAVDRAFAGAGPLFRVLHRPTRRRFARNEAVAFRHG